MKFGKFLLAVTSIFLISACDNAAMRIEDSSPKAGMNMLESGTQQSAADRAKETSNLLLAYKYGFDFSIPLKNIETVVDNAIESCNEAGTSKCQIVSSSINRYSEDSISSNIHLRVEPEWFETYRQSLIEDSENASGKLTASTVVAEDLTIAISDTDIRLTTLKTLRGRLQRLLESEGSSIKDLVEVERELARVQGEIETSTARLRVLRTRVEMSEVQLNYGTKSSAASRSSFAPIKYAFEEFFEVLSSGVASVIYFFAFTLPWFIIGIPVFLWIRRAWRRRKANKNKANTVA